MDRKFAISASLMLAAVLAACSTANSSPGSAPASALPSASPSGTGEYVADVDIGGRTLHVVCVGPVDTGRPTVVFEAGLTGDLFTWGDVMTSIKSTDRGCSYDRAGNGMSSPPDGTRTTKDQVADLHALLSAAAIKPPYVFVGFSLGGWNAMVYTDEFPEEVAGAILVDVRPPEASRRLLAALPPESESESEALTLNRADLTTFEHDPSLNSERLDLATSSDQAFGTAGFGSRPLVVLSAVDSADLWEGLEPDLAATLDGIWTDLQADLATRSSNGRQELVSDSGHHIPSERPDAIVDAIRAVLDEIGG